jgi:hypothetical protein
MLALLLCVARVEMLSCMIIKGVVIVDFLKKKKIELHTSSHAQHINPLVALRQ